MFLSRKEAFRHLEKLRAASGVRVGAQTVGHAVYISGRIFAYLLGLKDPRIVVGFGVEMDAALTRGDRRPSQQRRYGRPPKRRGVRQRRIQHSRDPDNSKRQVSPRFSNVPDADSLAKSDRERQLISLFREFMYPRWPYVLPPGTPAEIVKTLREAMNRSFKDPGLLKNLKNSWAASHRLSPEKR